MLMYFIIFTIVGFVIGYIVEENKKAFLIMASIAVIWGIIYAPMWGLVSLGEMSLGYFFANFNKD